MTKARWASMLAAVACTMTVAGASAQGDPGAGETKALPCMGCHGIIGYFNVYPSYHVPLVGGQHAEYIVQALKAYRSGERSHPTMRAQASSLDQQDMEDIAAYFSQLDSD